MAKRLAQLYKNHKTAFAGALVLLVITLVLAWNGLDIGRNTNNLKTFEIYNDDYSTRVNMDADRPDLTQELRVPADTTLYGLRLLFYTCEERMWGTVTVELQDAAGNVVATAGELATYDLPNGDFDEILFEQPLRVADYAEGDTAQLYLHLNYEPVVHDENRTTLQLACSDPAVDGLTMTRNDGVKDATLAVQFMTDYTGTESRGLYLAVALPLLLAVLLGWWLIFVRGAALHNTFAVVAALLGLAFALITPPLVGPDEYAHVAGSYAVASRILGQPTFDEDGDLYMRACDLPYMTDHTGDIGPWAYHTIARHMGENGNSGELVGTAAVRASDTKVTVLYAMQTIGILLARLLGLSFFGMLLLGRLCNLLLYVLLCRKAIALMPRGKNLLFTTALLPMGLQLATTFSADVLVIGLVFCYTALCMRCIGHRATRAEIAGMAVLALLIGPCKAIYVLVVGLCFWIPSDHLGGKRKALLLRLGLCAAAVAGWMLYNGSYILYLLRDFDYDALSRLTLPAALALAVLVVGAALLYRFVLRGHPRRQKRCLLIVAALCVAGAVLVLRYITAWGNIREEDKQASILPNGDSSITYAVGYVLRNPGDTLGLLIHTVAEQSPEWIQGVLGTSLGEPIVYKVEANWLLALALMVNMLLASLRQRSHPPRLTGWRRWYGTIIGLGVIGLAVLACITWTPINYHTIFGIQGRYFLPVVPLFLLSFGEMDALVLKEDYSRQFQFTSVWLAVLVMLQALGTYAAYKM